MGAPLRHHRRRFCFQRFLVLWSILLLSWFFYRTYNYYIYYHCDHHSGIAQSNSGGRRRNKGDDELAKGSLYFQQDDLDSGRSSPARDVFEGRSEEFHRPTSPQLLHTELKLDIILTGCHSPKDLDWNAPYFNLHHEEGKTLFSFLSSVCVIRDPLGNAEGGQEGTWPDLSSFSTSSPSISIFYSPIRNKDVPHRRELSVRACLNALRPLSSSSMEGGENNDRKEESASNDDHEREQEKKNSNEKKNMKKKINHPRGTHILFLDCHVHISHSYFPFWVQKLFQKSAVKTSSPSLGKNETRRSLKVAFVGCPVVTKDDTIHKGDDSIKNKRNEADDSGQHQLVYASKGLGLARSSLGLMYAYELSRGMPVADQQHERHQPPDDPTTSIAFPDSRCAFISRAIWDDIFQQVNPPNDDAQEGEGGGNSRSSSLLSGNNGDTDTEGDSMTSVLSSLQHLIFFSQYGNIVFNALQSVVQLERHKKKSVGMTSEKRFLSDCGEVLQQVSPATSSTASIWKSFCAGPDLWSAFCEDPIILQQIKKQMDPRRMTMLSPNPQQKPNENSFLQLHKNLRRQLGPLLDSLQMGGGTGGSQWSMLSVLKELDGELRSLLPHLKRNLYRLSSVCGSTRTLLLSVALVGGQQPLSMPSILVEDAPVLLLEQNQNPSAVPPPRLHAVRHMELSKEGWLRQLAVITDREDGKIGEEEETEIQKEKNQQYHLSQLMRSGNIFVTWYAHCCQCCGISNEAAAIFMALSDYVPLRSNLASPLCYCPMSDVYQNKLSLIHFDDFGEESCREAAKEGVQLSVAVMHDRPSNARQYINKCSRVFMEQNHNHRHRQPVVHYRISRLLHEVNPLPASWISELRSMFDEIWVPSQFVYDMVQQRLLLSSDADAKSSASKKKVEIKIIPEPVDSDFYHPDRIQKLSGKKLETRFRQWRGAVMNDDDWQERNEENNLENRDHPSDEDFYYFLSVFKWEARKGGDILVEAFLNAFLKINDKKKKKKVASPIPTLVLLTFHYTQKAVDRRDPEFLVNEIKKIQERVLLQHKQQKKKLESEGEKKNNFVQEIELVLPRIIIITEKISELEVAQLFQSSHAFVLPTRGEGWGLPIVQAMSMQLPTIATNYSAIVDYLTEENGYPLPILAKHQRAPESWREEIAVHPRASSTTKSAVEDEEEEWVVPNAKALTALMQQVYRERGSQRQKEKVKKARQLVVEKYRPAVVAKAMAVRLAEIYSLKVGF